MADEIAEATQGRGEYIDQPLTERNFGIVRSWLPRWCWNMASNFANIRHEFLDEKKWHFNLAMLPHKSTEAAEVLAQWHEVSLLLFSKLFQTQNKCSRPAGCL